MAYDTGKAVTREMVSLNLGNRALFLSPEEFKKVFEWFEQIKNQVGDFLHERIKNELVANVATLDLTNTKGIQEAWEDATTDEARLTIGKKIHDLWKSGFLKTKTGKLSWRRRRWINSSLNTRRTKIGGLKPKLDVFSSRCLAHGATLDARSTSEESPNMDTL